MAWVATITNQGVSMISNLPSGSVLNVTRAATGTGTTDSPATATAVSSVVSDAVKSVITQAESTGVRFIAKVYSSPNAYKMKQIGIFGKVNNGTEYLIILLQNTDGVDIPTSGNFPDFAFNITLFMQTDRATSFTATVDPDAMVTEAEFSSAMEIINAHFTEIDGEMEHLLPDVTASDNGKFLVVENGEWSAVRIASASGGTY